MRDFIEQLLTDAPLDPLGAARRGMRPKPRPRFYQAAGVAEGCGFRVVLDGKPVRTPGRRLLAAPSRELGEAIAAEWEAQREVIDAARMPLTRLANVIIDGVEDASHSVALEISNYLSSDLLCYRAQGPDGLVERQDKVWDPVLAWARDTLGAGFVVGSGVVYVTQPAAALAAAGAAIPRDPWRLGALASATALTGSALLALALMHGRLTAEQAWQAAHVDEDWNMERWGRDPLVLERRAARFAELQAAALVLLALAL